jgi:hypothetical protein
LQGEDAIVNPAYRGHGFGAALICFRARLAVENNLNFVAWESEDGDDALTRHRHRVFHALGGEKRQGYKPFRLDKTIIDQLPVATDAPVIQSVNVSYGYHDMKIRDYAWEGGRATVSPRFSLFRTLGRGHVDPQDPELGGYNQESFGVQIENLEFERADKAKHALTEIMQNEKMTERGCVFADIVVHEQNQKQMELVQSFDAAQNTYSGNPSFLWIIQGEALQKAAQRAATIQIV